MQQTKNDASDVGYGEQPPVTTIQRAFALNPIIVFGHLVGLVGLLPRFRQAVARNEPDGHNPERRKINRGRLEDHNVTAP